MIIKLITVEMVIFKAVEKAVSGTIIAKSSLSCDFRGPFHGVEELIVYRINISQILGESYLQLVSYNE